MTARETRASTSRIASTARALNQANIVVTGSLSATAKMMITAAAMTEVTSTHDRRTVLVHPVECAGEDPGPAEGVEVARGAVLEGQQTGEERGQHQPAHQGRHPGADELGRHGVETCSGAVRSEESFMTFSTALSLPMPLTIAHEVTAKRAAIRMTAV